MVLVYCSERLDGIAAAAIVTRHSTLRKLPASFGGFLHPEHLHKELEEISKKKGQLLMFLDMSFEADHLPLLEQISENNKIIYANTHDKESVKSPAKLFDHATERVCSAELAQKRFLPVDSIAKKLAKIAHDIEFWVRRDENAVKLSDLVAAKYNTSELIDNLSKGVFWSDNFERAHKEYLVKKENAFDELLKSLTIKSYVTHFFGFAYSPSVLSTADAGQKILDSHTGVDVSVVLYRDGTIAFRSRNNPDINLVEVASLFGGGGQPFASAAHLKHTITKEGFGNTIFDIDRTLKTHFFAPKL